MFKAVIALIVGLVGAAIVHIAVIFAMPWVASNNSWGRLARLGALFDVVRIDPQLTAPPEGVGPPAGSLRHEFPFVDPAFLTASCRFSLAEGPVRLRSDVSTSFWSASIYSRRGDNLYSINDRSAVGGRFDLLVGSADQLGDAKAASPDPNETTIPVEFSEGSGSLTIRALVDGESMQPEVEAFLRGLSCKAEAPPEDGDATEDAPAGG
ncbi:membrane protein [Aureimonas endophytica]|uniref:Membrane protein n=1 Tax=Aureimonas endophytica TaxID=2027858 RepID=A0A916ZFT2_9HYPH|nr:hypothetical protein [Aureimonas endophytica]GGD93898.1 membrane protein [Aureimonas endophytica]